MARAVVAVMPARSKTRVTGSWCRPMSSWLVEGPAEERRVDGDDGSQAAHGHAAAAVSSCCSAIPTSKNRSGIGPRREQTGRPGIAAVRATISGRCSASRSNAL